MASFRYIKKTQKQFSSGQEQSGQRGPGLGELFAEGECMNTGVSSRHGKIAFSTLELSDLGSTAGTHVNGRKVQSAILENGDVIGIGSYQIRFYHSKPVADGTVERVWCAPETSVAGRWITARDAMVRSIAYCAEQYWTYRWAVGPATSRLSTPRPSCRGVMFVSRPCLS